MSNNLIVNFKRAYRSFTKISTTKTSAPDYSSMEQEVEKIKHPVSFSFLKRFYGIMTSAGTSDPALGMDHTQVKQPDYSSMMQEIEKIKHPVSFQFLKGFYGITN